MIEHLFGRLASACAMQTSTSLNVFFLVFWIFFSTAISDVIAAATDATDTSRALPSENAVYFSATLRRVQLRLTKLNGKQLSKPFDSNVVIVNPEGGKLTVTVNERGDATLESATPGVYVIVVFGRDGYAAIPLVLRQREDGFASPESPVPVVEIPLMDLESKEALRVLRIYSSPIPSHSLTEIDKDFRENGKVMAQSNYRFQVNDDGNFAGQIQTLLREESIAARGRKVNVFIYQSGRLEHRTLADRDGRFTINDISPGVYGFIAVGNSGHAAFAFELVHPRSVAGLTKGVTEETHTIAKRKASTTRLVSTSLQSDGVFSALLIPPSMVSIVLEILQDGELPEDPISFSSLLNSELSGEFSAGGGNSESRAIPGGLGGGIPGLGSGGGGLLGAPIQGLAIVPPTPVSPFIP